MASNSARNQKMRLNYQYPIWLWWISSAVAAIIMEFFAQLDDGSLSALWIVVSFVPSTGFCLLYSLPALAFIYLFLWLLQNKIKSVVMYKLTLSFIGFAAVYFNSVLLARHFDLITLYLFALYFIDLLVVGAFLRLKKG